MLCYVMMAKRIIALELHNPMIQFLIIIFVLNQRMREQKICYDLKK